MAGGAASTPLANAIANVIFRNTPYTGPSSVWMAANTADPTRDPTTAATTEVTGGSYGRVNVLPADWGAPVDGLIAPNIDVVFPTATADWGLVTWVSFWDATSTGNYLLRGQLIVTHHIFSGDTLRFTAGNLTVRVF